MCPLADEDVGLVVECAGVVRIGALDLGEEERDVLEPRFEYAQRMKLSFAPGWRS